MKQVMLTVVAGKRLIGKATAAHPAVVNALQKGTVVIIAGTTNSYAAEEILAAIGRRDKFSRRRFFRGITLPPHYKITGAGRLAGETNFPAMWLSGTVFGRKARRLTKLWRI